MNILLRNSDQAVYLRSHIQVMRYMLGPLCFDTNNWILVSALRTLHAYTRPLNCRYLQQILLATYDLPDYFRPLSRDLI